MLRATSRLGDSVFVHFAETGGIEELADLVAQCQPQVVHLSGHGRVDHQGLGTFAFEDERGRPDSRTAEEIVTRVFRGSSVRLVFFNGCQTSQAAVAGLCQALVGAGVPLVLGWSARIADDRATAFAESFHRRLVAGESIPASVAHARDAIRRSGLFGEGEFRTQDASFALPHLYASTASSALFDRTAPQEAYDGPRTEYTLLGDGIKGLREGYIGRRREGQRIVPALREGEVTFAVITGLGGAGKSTFATRAANRLQAAGFTVVPVSVLATAKPDDAGRETLDRLTDALDRAFLMAGRENIHRLLADGKISLDKRLRIAVDALNEVRLAIVLDNFEDVLDQETRRIVDSDLLRLYLFLARNVTRGSRIIVTCRYLPDGTPLELPTVRHIPLPEFPEPDFLKFLRRDSEVSRRIERGELGRPLLAQLFATLGGTPGFLVQVRALLRTVDPESLVEELDGGDPDPLSQKREAYYQHIITARLYELLSANTRRTVSRLAISELPLPLDAVRRVTQLEADATTASLEAGIAYGFLQCFEEAGLPSLFHPPGLLRPWLYNSERLIDEDAYLVHVELARFWRESCETETGVEWRIPVALRLSICRTHASRGQERACFQWATIRLSNMLIRIAEWQNAKSLLEEIPSAERQVETWISLGTIENLRGDLEGAREALNRALSMSQDGEDRIGEATARNGLGNIELDCGNYEEARSQFEGSLAICRATGDREGEAVAWHGLASADLKRGSYHDALLKFENSLQIKRVVGDSGAEVRTLTSLASIRLTLGEYDKSRENLEQAREIAKGIGDRVGEANAWHQDASIDWNMGNLSAAKEKFEQSLKIKRTIGDRNGEANSLHSLALIDLRRTNHNDARQKTKEALEITQETGNRAGEAHCWEALAEVAAAQGNDEASSEQLARALTIAQDIGDRDIEARCVLTLASKAVERDQFEGAQKKFERVLFTYQEMGNLLGEAKAWYQLGSLAYKMGRVQEGLLLLAICCLIKGFFLGHGDAEKDISQLIALSQSLGYDDAQFDAMIVESAERYKQDRGRALITRAFPEKG